MYNPSLEPKNQWIALNTIMLDSFINKNNNDTNLRIAANDNLLLLMFQKFDTVYGIVSCNYQSYYSRADNKCLPCDPNKFQVGDYECYSCDNDSEVPSGYSSKFDFMCRLYNEDNYNPFILVFAVFGGVLITLLVCICLIILRIKGYICRESYLRQ